MRVLVTGASGFVGAAVVAQALALGDEVGAWLSQRHPPIRLGDHLEQITTMRGRLEDTEQVRGFLKRFQPEVCIHLAWYAEPGKYLTAPENLNSLRASISLMQLLIEAGCGHMLTVGTCAEYDTDLGYLNEDSATKPTTIYAATKLSMQLVGQHMSDHIGFTWARLFYLYGPHEDERRLTPALIQALFAGQAFAATAGEQIRDYLHVEDVARALVLLARGRIGGTFNISSGAPVRMREFMETVEALTGRAGLVQFGALPYRAWEPMLICGDNQKLIQAGWTPRYTLRQGLEQTVNWWAQRRNP